MKKNMIQKKVLQFFWETTTIIRWVCFSLVGGILFFVLLVSGNLHAQISGNFKVKDGLPVLPLYTGDIDTMLSAPPGYMIFYVFNDNDITPRADIELLVKSKNHNGRAVWRGWCRYDDFHWFPEDTITPFSVKNGVSNLPIRESFLGINKEPGSMLLSSSNVLFGLALSDGEEWTESYYLDFSEFDSDDNQSYFSIRNGIPVLPVLSTWPANTNREEGTFFIDNDWFKLIVFYNGSWRKIECLNNDCQDYYYVNHKESRYAPGNKTIRYWTHENEDDKTCWIRQSLGAYKRATKVKEDVNTETGWYFHFDKPQAIRVYANGDVDGTIPSQSSDDSWGAGTDPCKVMMGTLWRVPTKSHLENLEYNLTGSQGWLNGSRAYNTNMQLSNIGYIGSRYTNFIQNDITAVWYKTGYLELRTSSKEYVDYSDFETYPSLKQVRCVKEY